MGRVQELLQCHRGAQLPTSLLDILNNFISSFLQVSYILQLEAQELTQSSLSSSIFEMLPCLNS